MWTENGPRFLGAGVGSLIEIDYGIEYGTINCMKNQSLKKVTMELPEKLVAAALAETKQSLTETVRQGLEILVARRASKTLAALRGKLDLKISLSELRQDRKS